MSNDHNNYLFSQEEMDRLEPNSLFNPENQNEPITCLGMTFDSEDARREYFREELRKKLPELKQIEGFPIGEDDDIINLSDPPYYTACPNPWLNDFIEEWEKEKIVLEKEGKRKADFEVNEPYASDVSEGKFDPIYMYHPYLTKVPHKAIMHYLQKYTQEGDIIYDGFAGTGMTGVACTLMNRKCICGDLSSLASVISYNYLSGYNINSFIFKANAIIRNVTERYKWMFQTHHTNGELGQINYILWSDVFICPSCNNDIIFWNDGVDKDRGKVKLIVKCPHCGMETKKERLDNSTITSYDNILHKSIRQNKITPVKISYSYNNKRYEKEPDLEDQILLQRIDDEYNSLTSVCSERMPQGDEARRNDKRGITHTHQFYSKRNYIIINAIKNEIMEPIFNVLITKIAFQTTHLYRYTYMKGSWGAGGGPLSGTLYIPSLIKELNVLNQLSDAVNKRKNLLKLEGKNLSAITLQSATDTSNIRPSSVDYIFTDPPFGANLMYSELNVLSESWLKILTNNQREAIINKTQCKAVLDYQSLMQACFAQYYKLLRPGKWLTVEFSNTSASVWNSIQSALQGAGFIIANVSALDKQKGSFKAITTTTAVKQDLIITCFKPTDELTLKFEKNIEQGKNAMDFIDEFLEHLPVHLEKNNSTMVVIERSPKILYDRLISYYVQHGFLIPMDAQEFQKELRERYIEIDGMFFTATQAAEYQEKKKTAPEFISLGIIVSDEASGIQWLKNQLRDTPKTYQEIQPDWMQAINGLRKNDILPELKQILEENFIEMEGGKWRLPNIQDDVDKEALRTKSLLREFKKYVEAASKPKAKIKEARVEALRAGFKQCYIDKDFKTIVLVGDKIPQNLRDEDETLLQFYDIAANKM